MTKKVVINLLLLFTFLVTSLEVSAFCSHPTVLTDSTHTECEIPEYEIDPIIFAPLLTSLFIKDTKPSFETPVFFTFFVSSPKKYIHAHHLSLPPPSFS